MQTPSLEEVDEVTPVRYMQTFRKLVQRNRGHVGNLKGHRNGERHGDGSRRKGYMYDGCTTFAQSVRESILEATGRESGSIVFRFAGMAYMVNLSEIPDVSNKWIGCLDTWIKENVKASSIPSQNTPANFKARLCGQDLGITVSLV